jgi:hypothetical protein
MQAAWITLFIFLVPPLLC